MMAIADLIGSSARFQAVLEDVRVVAGADCSVLVQGETGTGKEVIARAIHDSSPRQKGPFVALNCAAIPAALLESELFGHEKGAFTGAVERRAGCFELAQNGTVLLDEIGDMPIATQAKLLRVLEDGRVRRLGGKAEIQLDVRVIAATNAPLDNAIREGKFREDLFYRLNVVRVGLPPLRERRDDIPLLVEHFLKKFADENKRPPRRIARAALHKLIGYRWPGNVRELENEVVRAASLGGETISVDDLSPPVAAGEPEAAVDSPDDLGIKPRVERLERTLLREALHRADGNQTQAAKLLGLSRFGLQKKLRRYGLDA